MKMWLNNIKILKENLNKEKPCHKLGWCPYGGLVEEFPFTKEGKVNCEVFGHHCPMFYNAKDITEQDKEKIIRKIAERKK